MAEVLVRYWAGARRAAGCESETLSAGTVGELCELLAARVALSKICAVASFLVDGIHADVDTVLADGSVVDMLPPFAGGSAAQWQQADETAIGARVEGNGHVDRR